MNYTEAVNNAKALAATENTAYMVSQSYDLHNARVYYIIWSVTEGYINGTVVNPDGSTERIEI